MYLEKLLIFSNKLILTFIKIAVKIRDFICLLYFFTAMYSFPYRKPSARFKC